MDDGLKLLLSLAGWLIIICFVILFINKVGDYIHKDEIYTCELLGEEWELNIEKETRKGYTLCCTNIYQDNVDTGEDYCKAFKTSLLSANQKVETKK